ncbi:hypothetical protein [Paenisporosarcina sp. NPDC076898]
MIMTTNMTTEQFNEKVQIMLAEIREMNEKTSQTIDRIEATVYA